MTQEEFDKAPKIEQVLYDCTGMLSENHSDIIEAMTIYAESEVKKLNILAVSKRSELLLAMFDLAQTMPDNLTLLDKIKIVDKFIANNCC